MKCISSIFLLLFFLNCKTTHIDRIYGKYSGGNDFTAEKLEIKSDGSAVFNSFADVGGWSKPIEVIWSLHKDTLILNSPWLPKIVSVSENNSPGLENNIEVTIWSKNDNTPFYWNYELRIDSILCTNGKFDSILVKEKVFQPIMRYYFDFDSLIISPKQFFLDINGSKQVYGIKNQTNNKFRLFLNCSEDSIFNKYFLHNDKWIVRGDTLYDVSGKLKEKFYLLKSKSTD